MRRQRSLFVFLCTVACLPLQAQRIWLPTTDAQYVGFELGKGFFDTGSGGFSINASTAYFHLYGRFTAGERTGVTVELPVSHVSEDTPFDATISGSRVGNPWLGLQYRSNERLVFDFGIRPGLAKESSPAASDALYFATLTDFDRFEAWLPRTTSLRGVAHIGEVPARGAFITGFAGGSVTIPNSGYGKTDLWGSYGVRAGVAQGELLGSVALTGRARLTRGGSFNERTVHQVAAALERASGRVRPSASIRFWLDKGFRDAVKAVLSLGVVATF